MGENRRGICRTELIVLVAISLMLCSLSGEIHQGKAGTSLGTPFQTLMPINATLATPIGQVTSAPTPLPIVGPPGSTVYIEGDTLAVGSDAYPIGDEFLDASGIPTGASTKSHFGDFGYAVIRGIEDHILLWITDNEGIKHYLIVSVADTLFAGHENVEDGFINYMELLRKAEQGMLWGLGAEWGGVGAVIGAQLILCGPTGGSTCVSAILTAIGAGIAGFVKFAFHFIFDYLPQIDNLRDQFEQIDTLRPKVP